MPQQTALIPNPCFYDLASTAIVTVAIATVVAAVAVAVAGKAVTAVMATGASRSVKE